jgi:hypothetical protein
MGFGEVNAVLPAGRAAKPAARAFTEFLVAELRDLSEWRSERIAPGSEERRQRGSVPRAARGSGHPRPE